MTEARGVTDEGLFEPRCEFPSSVSDATCILRPGHPADGPFRFHRFARVGVRPALSCPQMAEKHPTDSAKYFEVTNDGLRCPLCGCAFEMGPTVLKFE